MQTARIPQDEAARLDALQRLAILDTGEEDFFEDIADTARQLIGAPIVLVTFIDESRQWFKARRGMPVAGGPRDSAFCAHTILSDAPLLVGDARGDARFRGNPAVTADPGIASYLGVALKLACGARPGTICVGDASPRTWTPQDVAHLQRCARMISRHLDTRRAHLEQHRQVFMEQALARSQVRYESVLNTMTEGMVVQGPTGAIIDSNPAAALILGRPHDSLFGAASRDPDWRTRNLAGEDVTGDAHPAMIVLRTGQPQHNVILSIETPSGERRWLTINSYPVRHADDLTVRQAVTVFRRIDPPAVEHATPRWANDRE